MWQEGGALPRHAQCSPTLQTRRMFLFWVPLYEFAVQWRAEVGTLGSGLHCSWQRQRQSPQLPMPTP